MPDAPAPPAPPPSSLPATPTGPQADAKIVDVLKDTFVGSILADINAREGKESAEGEAVDRPAAGPAPDKSDQTSEHPQSSETRGESQHDSPKVPDPAVEPKESKRKKGRPTAPPPSPAVDPQRLAESVAQATVRAQQESARADQQAKLEATIPDAVKKMRPVYEELHKSNPEKYPQDLDARMARFVSAEQARAEEWEKSNPGQDYDSEAPEHSDWYEKNQPKIDQDDVIDARATIKAREIYQKEMAPRQADTEERLERQRVEPEVRRAAESLGKNILKAVVPDFKDEEINKDTIKKIAEADPIAAQAAYTVDNHYANVVYQAGLMFNGLEQFDEKNPFHMETRTILKELEEVVSQVPPEKITRNGKRWVPLEQWVQTPKAQRSQVFTTSYEDLVDFVRAHVAPTQAKALYERELENSKTLVEKLSGRFGYKKSEEGTSTPGKTVSSGNGASTQNAQTPAAPAPRITSPSMPAGTPPGNNTAANNGGSNDFMGQFFDRVLGR